MARHGFTVTSPLSVEQAFELLVDLERVPEWDDGVQAAERLPHRLDDDPLVGRRFEVTLTGFDRSPTTVVYEITEATSPHRFVMVGENDEFRAADTLELAPTAHGCELHYDGTLELLGDDPPLTPQQLDSMFPKLAAVAEAGLRRFLAG